MNGYWVELQLKNQPNASNTDRSSIKDSSETFDVSELYELSELLIPIVCLQEIHSTSNSNQTFSFELRRYRAA